MVFVETSFPRGGAVKPKSASVEGDKSKEKRIVRTCFFSVSIFPYLNVLILIFIGIRCNCISKTEKRQAK